MNGSRRRKRKVEKVESKKIKEKEKKGQKEKKQKRWMLGSAFRVRGRRVEVNPGRTVSKLGEVFPLF